MERSDDNGSEIFTRPNVDPSEVELQARKNEWLKWLGIYIGLNALAFVLLWLIAMILIPPSWSAVSSLLVSIGYASACLETGRWIRDKRLQLEQEMPYTTRTLYVVALANSILAYSIYDNFLARAVIWLLALVALPVLLLRHYRLTSTEAEKLFELTSLYPTTMSKRARKALAPNEELRLETHKHVVSLSSWIAAIIGGFALVLLWQGTPFSSSGLLWAVGCVAFVVRIAYWHADTYCFTSNRIVRIYGLLNVRTAVMPNSKLTDTGTSVSLISRMLTAARITKAEFGDLTVESAGQDQQLTNLTCLPYINVISRQLATYFARDTSSEEEQVDE